MEIKITKGVYNTRDYKVIKSYTRIKSALKFINKKFFNGITSPFTLDDLYNNYEINYYGTKYTIKVSY